MPKTRKQKESTISSLVDSLKQSKIVLFTNFDGLNVKATTEMRNLLRENGIDYQVVKRTLIRLALKKEKMEGIDLEQAKGGLGVAFGLDDEVAPAKVLAQFAKKNPALKLVGGLYNRNFIDAEKVKELSKLPGKNELHGKLVWLFNYPMSGLVNVFAGNLKSLLYALQAIKDRKSTA